MPLGSVNFQVSRANTKGGMIQALHKGLALSFEISVLVLLLFLRFVELGGSSDRLYLRI